jgi:hypothetical protein
MAAFAVGSARAPQPQSAIAKVLSWIGKFIIVFEILE